MNRARFEHLDTWLAVQEAAGVRFAGRLGGQPSPGNEGFCTMVAYDRDAGYRDTGFSSAAACGARLHLLWRANDESRGDPAAVRRKLHELFPEYVSPLQVQEQQEMASR